MKQITSELVPTGCDGKADTGKVRMSLLTGQFRCALAGIARILTFGAKKYPDPETGDRSWVGVENAVERYTDAFERHMNYVYADTELVLRKKVHPGHGVFVAQGYIPNVDAESGELHIDHAITNLLFLRTLLYGASK